LKKIKTLFVQFDNHLPKNEVSAFRGAIINKVGEDQVAFHNHIGDTQLLYKMPIIQYKSINGKPCIFCIGDGVHEIQNLFSQNDLSINIKTRKVNLSIGKIDMAFHHLNMLPTPQEYTVYSWLALNEANILEYNKADALTDKIKLLEKILVGNILSFAKGIELSINEPIKVTILEINKETVARYKGTGLKAFDVKFKANIALPSFMGLGKGVSHGFGTIRKNTN
jgi:hypothetical protein